MLGPSLSAAAFSPVGTEREGGGTGSLQPCQESPGGPAGVTQGGPDPSPHALPNPGQGTAQRFCPWKGMEYKTPPAA